MSTYTYLNEKIVELYKKKDTKQLGRILIDGDISERSEAAYALGEIGDPKSLKVLIKSLRDNSSDVRAMAAKGLGNLNSKKAVKPLIKALYDDNDLVSEYAAISLGRLEDEQAVMPLIKVLRGSDGRWHGAAASALGNLGDVRAVDLLIQMMEDHFSLSPENAVKALGKIGDKRAIAPLTKIIDTQVKTGMTSSSLLEKVVAALVLLGEQQKIVESLINELKDEDRFKQNRVIELLGLFGDAQAVDPLISMFGSESWMIKKTAAIALGEIGDIRAIELQLNWLDESYSCKDYDEVDREVIREISVEALCKIGCKNGLEDTEKLFEQSDSSVNKTVKEMFLKLSGQNS